MLEASHAEIVACLQAAQRAIDLGVQKLILESDAMTVIQAVNSSVFDRSSASGLLWELKECLSSNFTSCHVACIPRSCNLVSHSLAALGTSLSPGTNPIKDCIPNCIDVLVASDLTSGHE